MGTNFYAESKPCPCCGHVKESKHIGKSSAGWCFALHVYPDEGINSLEDWKKYWEDKEIRDEYGAQYTPITILDNIENRSWARKEQPHGHNNWVHFHSMNHSQDGPNGLIRSKVDGHHCIGHGDGTWDLFVGDFS